MSFSNQKIVKIELLYQVQENISPEQKQERSIAVYDLMENNSFHLIGHNGPYHLYLSKQTRHLLFEIKSIKEIPINSFYLALGPFRKLIRDYIYVEDVANAYIFLWFRRPKVPIGGGGYRIADETEPVPL